MKKSLVFSLFVVAMILVGYSGMALAATTNIYVTADQDIVSGWDYKKGTSGYDQEYPANPAENPNIVQAGGGSLSGTYRDTTLTFDLSSLAGYALDAIQSITLNYNVLTTELGYSGKITTPTWNISTTVGTVNLGDTSYTLTVNDPLGLTTLDFTAAVKASLSAGTSAVFTFLHDPDLFNADPLLVTKANKITFGSADGGDAAFLSVNTSAVPVPAAFWLLGSALAGLGVIRRRVA